MRAIRAFLSGLNGNMRKQRLERELAEEFESHLAMQIADNLRAGMSPEQARREALLKSGGLKHPRRTAGTAAGFPSSRRFSGTSPIPCAKCAGAPVLRQWLSSRWHWASAPTQAMFSIVHAALLKPLPFRDPERLVLARCTIGGVINPYVSTPDYYDYREQANDFEGFSAVLHPRRRRRFWEMPARSAPLPWSLRTICSRHWASLPQPGVGSRRRRAGPERRTWSW